MCVDGDQARISGGVKGLLVNLIIIIFQSSSQGASTSLHYFIGSAEKRRKTTYKRNVNNI